MIQLRFEGGQEPLQYGAIQAATHGGRVAGDLGALRRLASVSRSELAALISVDQQLLRFDLAVSKGPVRVLDFLLYLHCGTELPDNDIPAEQVDLYGQVSPARGGTDFGDVTHSAAVWYRRLEVLLMQVLLHPIGPVAFAAWTDVLSGSGPEIGTLQPRCGSLWLEPCDIVTTNPLAGRRQIISYARGAIDAPVLLAHLWISELIEPFGHPLSRRLMPLPPGVEAAVGHPQLQAQPRG